MSVTYDKELQITICGISKQFLEYAKFIHRQHLCRKKKKKKIN